MVEGYLSSQGGNKSLNHLGANVIVLVLVLVKVHSFSIAYLGG